MSLVWILAGLAGGAAAGLLDVAVAVAGGIGGMSVGKALRLALVAAGLLAVAGGIGGTVIAAGEALVRRTRNPGRWAALAWAVAAAPLIAHDAIALFAGTQAAKLPGHRFISAALIVAGTAAVGLASRLYQAASQPDAGTQRRRTALAALIITAVAAEAANRWVLPRLYGWFHATLAVVSLALAVLAARLLLRRPLRASRVALVAVAACAACAGAILQVRTSQVMRYAAHERTAMTALALRGVPQSLRAPRASATERRATDVALPPLPDGPRRPQADVLLITIDALRADHVGAYGYPRGDDARHRRAGRVAACASARLRPGAAHVVFGRVDVDRRNISRP